MFDLLTNALIGIGIGGVTGAVGAFLGWNSSGEPFITRKFITGVATGAITGIGLGFLNALAFKNVTDELALLVIYGDIFAGALAATLAVPKVSAFTGRTEEPAPSTIK